MWRTPVLILSLISLGVCAAESDKTKWAPPSSGCAAASLPHVSSLAISPEGRIYAASGVDDGFWIIDPDGSMMKSSVVPRGSVFGPMLAAHTVDEQALFALPDRLTIERLNTDMSHQLLVGKPGSISIKDGNKDVATFSSITAITTSPEGEIYVADGAVIRKIDKTLNVSRFAGSHIVPVGQDARVRASRDGRFHVATFGNISALASDDKTLYVAEENQTQIKLRRVSYSGEVKTLFKADLDAHVKGLGAIATTSDGDLIFSEHFSEPGRLQYVSIRKMTPEGKISEIFPGTPWIPIVWSVSAMGIDLAQNIVIADAFTGRLFRLSHRGVFEYLCAAPT